MDQYKKIDYLGLYGVSVMTDQDLYNSLVIAITAYSRDKKNSVYVTNLTRALLAEGVHIDIGASTQRHVICIILAVMKGQNCGWYDYHALARRAPVAEAMMPFFEYVKTALPQYFRTDDTD